MVAVIDTIAKTAYKLLNGREHPDMQYMREEGLYMPALVLAGVVEVWVALLMFS